MRRKISPQIRFAVERALARAKEQVVLAEKKEAEYRGVSLQGEGWRDECESLAEAVEILKGLE